MRAINRKLLRDLVGSAGTLSSVVAIIAIGSACFVGMASASRILSMSQASYYSEYRFADFWFAVKKAPLTAVESASQINGVASIEGRVVFDVILDLPDVDRPLTGRLISVSPARIGTSLNSLCLIRGSLFSQDRDEEVILGEAFAREHGLDPGDTIELILNRKRQSFAIVGTAISPEYVYMTRGNGDLIPDARHFGILYVKERFARDALDFKDACNDVVGRVVPGADVEQVMRSVERQLEPYGVLSATPRERQASHRFLSDEIKQETVGATLIPGIFLFVAALVLNVLLVRLAERQRAIIGTLKALGYSNWAISMHFLAFGLVIGLIGGVLGDLLGILCAWSLVTVYSHLFQFPSFEFQAFGDLLATGVGVGLLFSAVGALKGVSNVLKLQPAEAMRQRPPARGGRVPLEAWRWLWRKLDFRTHIAIRTVVRYPVRSCTGVLSIALATSIMLMTLIMYQSIWRLVDYQFEQVARSDVDLGLRDERTLSALYETRELPGIDVAEPVFGLTCDARHDWRSRRITITGLATNHRLTIPRGVGGAPLEIPEHGLVLTRQLAEILGVQAGDLLELTPARGRRDPVEAVVGAVAESYVGLESYADIRYLSRIAGESLAVGAVQTKLNPAQSSALYRAVKQLPNIGGVNVRADSRHMLEETFVEVTVVIYGILIAFAGVIAFGSTLNNALVEMGDRVRDISTFRVLGYHSSQVAAIFFRQSLILFCAGFVLGIPLGTIMTILVVSNTPTEQFRLPIQVNAQVVFLTAGFESLFLLLSQAVIYWQIRRLDWLEGVKVKE